MRERKKENCKGIVTNIARIVGQQTATTKCYCWFNQPRIPEKLKEKIAKQKN